MQHLITDIQRFSLNDGPGIRTTVFFKGCNMRCAWCHNPETLSPSPDLMFYPSKCISCGKCFTACSVGAHILENGLHIIDRKLCKKCGKCTEICYAEALVMSGREMTVDEILFEVCQDKAYYDASGGGVTLSGGEVLCHTDFAAKLARACHEEGIRVAVETNLSLPYDHIRPLLSEVDLIMADLKLYDEEEHKKHTGLSNKNTIENILSIRDIPMIIRTPLIDGITATKENLRAIAGLLEGKKNLIYYQLLNFNPLGASKYESLDAANSFSNLMPYNEEEMSAFGEMLSDINIRVKVGE
ncbi:MAG: glycyl-radical enzyme activating protein [Clostridia bacterium]|nr:glycyl-radical enzyme activating protein [Clostridia bacterium]